MTCIAAHRRGAGHARRLPRITSLRGAGPLALLALLIAPQARAVDALLLQAAEVKIGTTVARDVQLRLDLADAPKVLLRLNAATLTLPQLPAGLRAIKVSCRNPSIGLPRISCPQGALQALGGPTGSISAAIAGDYRSDVAAFTLQGRNIALAGGRARLAAHGDARGWAVDVSLASGSLAPARKLLAPWLALPAQFTLRGSLNAHAVLSGRPSIDHAKLDAQLAGIDLSNALGTIVAEKLSARLALEARPVAGGYALELRLAGDAGQALTGPVLLDLAKNPLEFAATGQYANGALQLPFMKLDQRALLHARGTARARLAPRPALEDARITIDSLEFPAAYTSFLQIALAATEFGALTTSGSATGEIEIAHAAPARLALRVANINLADPSRKFHLDGLAAELHWAAAAAASNLPASHLSWQSAGYHGLEGGTASFDFIASAMGAALIRPARISIFDGAVAVRSFAIHDIDRPALALEFDADIEPISMQRLSIAFGWPQLLGELSGRIPALAYHDKTLTVGGDVEAHVFNGTITGSGLRLQDPFGPWPRLFADVKARDLDLELVTRTFAVGSITGRLEGEVNGLELFAWSPVAFKARLATPAGDRSTHRISAKAVGNLANIGGGGGNVISALEHGFLRFFREFGYQRLGIACELRDDVCSMSGIEPAATGYYIVKGSGIPRIDIIGNAGRVNWPQLVSQIVAGMQSEGPVVR